MICNSNNLEICQCVLNIHGISVIPVLGHACFWPSFDSSLQIKSSTAYACLLSGHQFLSLIDNVLVLFLFVWDMTTMFGHENCCFVSFLDWLKNKHDNTCPFVKVKFIFDPSYFLTWLSYSSQERIIHICMLRFQKDTNHRGISLPCYRSVFSLTVCFG